MKILDKYMEIYYNITIENKQQHKEKEGIYMRTITVKHNIYNYSELSTEAKERVKKDYIEDLGKLAFIFTDNCNDRLNELFPNSDLKVQYSLSYCQGDRRLNIYGNLNLNDILENIKEKFSEKEIEYIKCCLDEFGSDFKMPCATHYNYCICDRHDYTAYLIEELENNQVKEYMILYNFDGYIKNYMTNLCKEFESEGYDYFYPELTDEEMEEIADDNSWEFYENGRIYNE